MLTMMVRQALARQEEEEKYQQLLEGMEGEKQLEPYWDNCYDDSVDGDGPCEVSHTSIFALLPEIWETCILPDLSSNDFHSLINASGQWRNMFQSQIANELLPLVLPILMNHKSITVKSLLTWRQVSRKSKSVIDTMVQESLSPERYYDQLSSKYLEWSPVVVDRNHHFRRAVKEIKSRYKFKCPSRLQKFTAHLASGSNESKWNNFPHPSVMELLMEEDNDITIDLLAAYGHNLSMVSLDVSSVSAPLVISLLSFLPNLRVLKLKGLIVPMCYWSETRQRQPLQLNHLEVLNLERLNDHLSPLYGEDGFNATLLRHCGTKLEKLICSREFFNSEVVFRMVSSGCFPNLRCLRVEVDLCTCAALARMRGLFLKELQMVDSNLTCAANHDLSYVIPAINTFAKTLTHLRLLIRVKVGRKGLHDVGESDDEDGLPDAKVITLPKLKKLSTALINVRQDWFWPFLQSRCRNLEELNLHNGDELSSCTSDIQNQIDIKRGFALLPRLQRIEVFCGFCNGVWTGKGARPPRKIVIRRDRPIQTIDLEVKKTLIAQ